MRFGALLALFVIALGGTLPRAYAHGEAPGLDLEELTDHVGDRIQATSTGDRKVHAAFVRLGRALLKESRKGLPDDLKKLSIVARESSRHLAAENGLADLLAEAMAEAREVMDRFPASTEEAIDQVDPARWSKLEKIALAARARSLLGRSGAIDDRARLALWKKAATGFLKVDRLADALVHRQGGPTDRTLAAEPGKIYTIAGRGSGGYNGDGLPARASYLYWVEEIKFGPDGRLYILDWNNHMLRRLEEDGTLTRICGQGVPGDSEGDPFTTQLNHPSAVDFDAQGRIFIAAWHNHKVKVYDPNGGNPVVYTIAGGAQGNAGDGGPATDALFNLLPGVLLLPEGHPMGGGDLLCTDAANQCVRVVRLATDPVMDENVAGTVVSTGVVERIFGTGIQGSDGDGEPASGARVGFSKAQNAESDGRMTMDAAGNIFLVSGVENRIRRITPEGVIHTVAGNGTHGFSGDGEAAVDASLAFPSDVAVLPDGTLYISDQDNHVIRRVDPSGIISTYAGIPGDPGYDGEGGAATAARMHRPTGLEVDAEGNLYFCDKDNSVIRVIPAEGTTLRVPRLPYFLPALDAGAPPTKGPSGTIETYAGTGNSAFTGDGRPALETDFYWPQDLTVQPGTGLLHVVDWNNHRIRRIEDDGTVRTVVGVGELGDTDGDPLLARMNHPTDASFDPLTGDLHIASWHTDRVKRLVASTNLLETANKPGGKRTFSGDGGPLSLAEFNLPSSVKFDSEGNMYIGDEGNRRVRRVDRETQVIETIAGNGTAGFSGDGDLAVNAQLNLPLGQSAQPAGKVCLDPTDRYVYIADTDNHRVRRIDQETGLISTVAGNGTAAFSGDGGQATAASLNSPVDVDCDAEGNLYICDRDNHCVRRVDAATGIITTVAGTGGEDGYSGDGGPGSSARLDLPCGIHVDRSTGRLYIADTFNSVLRVVWE